MNFSEGCVTNGGRTIYEFKTFDIEPLDHRDHKDITNGAHNDYKTRPLDAVLKDNFTSEKDISDSILHLEEYV